MASEVPSQEIVFDCVTSDVNSTRNDGPELIQPVSEGWASSGRIALDPLVMVNLRRRS